MLAEPLDALDEALISALRIGVLRLSRRLRLELDGDLTLTQVSVLGTVLREGPLTIGELAAHEHVKPPSVTRTVTCLEEAGLLARRSSDDDGRQVIVSITESGKAVLDETRRRRDAWLREHLAQLTADERRILEAAAPLLDRLAQP